MAKDTEALLAYRVRGWDAHYENFKSRTVDECSFVCVPNKQDGLGLARILAEPDGASIYGIWNLILGACSRHRRPRNGWLTDTGRVQGRPWSVSDLSIRWRRTVEEIARALTILSSDSVGWIESVPLAPTLQDTQLRVEGAHDGIFDRTSDEKIPQSEVVAGDVNMDGIRSVSGQYPPGILEGKGREENRSELRLEVACGEPASRTSPPPAAVFPIFPCIAGKRAKADRWRLEDEFVTELQTTFPGVNVLGEARKAFGWIKANPQKRKTFTGMTKFIFDWMARAQNRVPVSSGNTNHPAGRASSSQDWKKKPAAFG